MENKEYKKTKKLADNLHNVKMKNMLEDSIQISDPNRNYIKINGKKIEDIIKENAEKMLTINGEIDPANIVNNDIVDLNLLSLYDSNNNLINYDLEGVRKGKEYWEEKTDEYIKSLQERLNADLSNISKDELKGLIVEHNREFLTTFRAGIKANALDLADKSTQVGYANRLANTLTDLQAQEIQKIGIENFLKLDLDKKPYQIIYYIDVDILKNLQKTAKDTYDKAEDTLKHSLTIFKTKEQLTFDVLVSEILVNAIGQQIQRVKKIYNDDKKFYDSRHKKRKKIDKLLIDISKKYKDLSDYLSTPRTRALDVSKREDILNQVATQDKNIEKTNYTTTLVGKYFFNGKYEIGTAYPVVIDKDRDIQTNFTLVETGNAIKLAGTDKTITLTKDLKAINDAVGTLVDSKYNVITSKQLYNFITKGKISNDYVPQENIDDLLDKLNKLKITGEIDATIQLQDTGYQAILEDYERTTGEKAQPKLQKDLISFEILKDVVLPNKEKTDLILFTSYPLLYQYAKQLKQIAPVPAEIKDINYTPKPSGKNNTIQITALTSLLRDELISEILLRKSRQNNPINLNNFLAKNCNFYDIIDKNNTDNVLNPNQRKRYIAKIETILNNFKDKKFIQSYKVIRKGKVVKHSIQLIFNDVPKLAVKDNTKK